MTMSSEPKREILIAAAVLLNEHRQMLVVRKRGTTQFMQPGGKIDPGETPEQALHRELAEEIGLTLPEHAVRYEGIFREEAANEPGADVVAHAFTARLHAEVTPQAEIEEVRWLDLDRNPGVTIVRLTETQMLPLARAALTESDNQQR
ncbi:MULTISPECIES: NUDIX hydrolase [Agrobacterium]|jgi:8-oxo-dGTP diphosphatase|uniref:NUDIX hydrolase n=1 Tax=Agrobacterium TaxID=357 RepID=UPI0022B855A5|nr:MULTISPECIES: NUDIX domain-containing protein [Agrobacterium]MCZ7887594.1 NUDIX domain-containing protein [Agrobacterium salinitolerans]MDA5629783.1 NUDIX domain-containing protein [Agrobacterium sp. ST15.16.055]MDA6982138.1 NUDIX domain-containing protein [Agrobacterium salinitolerans]